jgi:hypothetical protein
MRSRRRTVGDPYQTFQLAPLDAIMGGWRIQGLPVWPRRSGSSGAWLRLFSAARAGGVRLAPLPTTT